MPQQSKNKKSKIALLVIITIAASLFSYTTYRAAHLCFTIDESLSYSMFIQIHSSFNDIIALKNATANNHILNSFLMQGTNALFGSSELSLRLPNLAGHLLFMLFTALWLRRFKNPLIIICGFIIINANPYMLDFFSLARGYGLAVACMSGSIYLFFRFMDRRNKRTMMGSLFFCFLAITANFALLHFFLGLILAYNIYFFFESTDDQIVSSQRIKKWLKWNIPVAIFFVGTAAFCWEPIRRLTQSHQLYFGGINGFWQDTVTSLMVSYLYWGSHLIVYTIVKVFIIFCGLGGLIILLFSFLKKYKNIRNQPVVYSFILVIVPVLTTIIQHELLGNRLLVFRTALFFDPLFLMFLVTIMYFIVSCLRLKIIGFGMILVITIAILFNWSLKFNLTHCQEWEWDASIRDAVTAVANDAAIHHNGHRISIGISWQYEPSLNYYRETRHYLWMEKLSRKGIEQDHEYYYVYKPDFKYLPKKSLHVMAAYPATDSYLLSSY